MSDLSRMLDDLYALPSTDDDATPEAEPARAPAWSSEEALDEVFSSWVPGPTADAKPAQRSFLDGLDDEPVAPPAAPRDTWLIDTDPEPEPAPEPEPVAELVTAGAPSVARWSPSDDDIHPRRARRGRSRRR
jgi:hypothetical protein